MSRELGAGQVLQIDGQGIAAQESRGVINGDLCEELAQAARVGECLVLQGKPQGAQVDPGLGEPQRLDQIAHPHSPPGPSPALDTPHNAE
jgi:hypothetical protein